MSEKVLMYARVGNIGQMAEASLDLQLQAVEEFCRQKGYEIVGTKTCVGGGEKAISFLPPLAEEAKQREATMIVTCSMDRFTRGGNAGQFGNPLCRRKLRDNIYR